jgi:hypothetical protein
MSFYANMYSEEELHYIGASKKHGGGKVYAQCSEEWDDKNKRCVCGGDRMAVLIETEDKSSYSDYINEINHYGCKLFANGDFRSHQDDITAYNHFQGQNMEGANFEGINFTGKYMAGAFLRNAKLKNANFHTAVLFGVNFEGADAQGAEFIWAESLEKASFKNADLRGAKFNNAQKMNWTNFTNAKLQGADFTGAKNFESIFTDAQLEEAIWFDGKKCGPGSIGVCKYVD